MKEGSKEPTAIRIDNRIRPSLRCPVAGAYSVFSERVQIELNLN